MKPVLSRRGFAIQTRVDDSNAGEVGLANRGVEDEREKSA
jgi:hypothetical protein